MSPRAIDALCDAYVDDFCALDPLTPRAAVQQRQGADFDLKAFHRAALDLGSLGLDPLRAALERL